MKEPLPGIRALPHQENLRHFDVEIEGPQETPYAGGTFKLELFLPEEYPMEPPKVRFLTRIYHPNIDRLGRICLDILKGIINDWMLASFRFCCVDKWSPALQVRTVLLSVQALLAGPNPDDPLANDVAQHWKADEPAALEEARNWTQKYATATKEAETE